MPFTAITAKFVNPRKPGFPHPSIKDTNGTSWGFKDKGLVSQFQAGHTYDIEYGETQAGNGKTYFNILRLATSPQPSPQPQQQPRPIPQPQAQSPAYQTTLDAAEIKNRLITRVAIAKSILESHPDMQIIGNVAAQQDVANQWLAWVYAP